eukprot:SAG22_NODE_577_length_8975_cov_12.406827_5_plen_66_part_00
MIRQSGLTVRDSFYAYARGDRMSMAEFRRFVENTALRITQVHRHGRYTFASFAGPPSPFILTTAA